MSKLTLGEEFILDSKEDIQKDNIKNWMTHIQKPQTTSVLGYTGIFGQLFNILKDIQIGELWPYILTLSYGDLLTISAPIIVFLWAIIHDEKK